MSKKKKYYAVKTTGQIFTEWSDCEQVVKGTKGVKYKSFPTREQAEAYLNGDAPSVSALLTREPIAYNSVTGLSGTVRILEDCDPLTLDLEGYVYSIDGSFNIDTGYYGGAFACYKGGELLDAKAIANNKPQFASSRNIAGEVSGFGLAIEDAVSRGLTKLTIVCDYEGIFRWAVPKSISINGQSGWEGSTTKSVGKYHAYLVAFAVIRGIRNIDFIWVRGHRGVGINNTADCLAKEVVGLK